MNHNYPNHVLKILREAEGLDSTDTGRDEQLQDIFPESVFDAMLEYEGIIGYSYKILNWIEDIFKVKLVVDGQEQDIEEFKQGLHNIFEAQNLEDDAIQQMADVICTTIQLER